MTVTGHAISAQFLTENIPSPALFYEQLWHRRDGGIRINEIAESTYGAALLGRYVGALSF